MSTQKFRVVYDIEYEGAEPVTPAEVKKDLSLDSDNIDAFIFTSQIISVERKR